MDGESIAIGAVRVEALHTPGHTPAHLSLLVYDLARPAETPMLMLSGTSSSFAPSGRPDLLGRGAEERWRNGFCGASARSSRSCPTDSSHPAHGAGSMCGADIGGRPVSTLGFERIANPYLDPKLTRGKSSRSSFYTTPFPDY